MIAISTHPILAFAEADLIPAPTPGTFAIVWPKGSDTVLSINAQGNYETRPKDAIGSNETFRKFGDKLVGVIPEGVFVIPFVEWA